MRITVNQYAKTLYEATKDKSQKEINGLVLNFVKILAKNRQIKLSSKIVKKFREIWNQASETVEAEAISVNVLNGSQIKKIEEFISNKYQVKKVILKNSIDEKIKGGIIIKIGDEVLDGSMKEQLIRLRNNLIN